mmetsp:Transcript_11979/g.24780  ORF Transcript_11979/g.24780 Transcript_11979/m.24780 type:complete len:127 (+) Transcript_11979:272-652(+)
MVFTSVSGSLMMKDLPCGNQLTQGEYVGRVGSVVWDIRSIIFSGKVRPDPPPVPVAVVDAVDAREIMPVAPVPEDVSEARETLEPRRRIVNLFSVVVAGNFVMGGQSRFVENAMASTMVFPLTQDV